MSQPIKLLDFCLNQSDSQSYQQKLARLFVSQCSASTHTNQLSYGFHACLKPTLMPE